MARCGSRPAFNIETHYGLLEYARTEAARRGWSARLVAVDQDPDHNGPLPRELPGAGVLVLYRGPRNTAIPYHLPEASVRVTAALDDLDAVGRHYSRMAVS